MEEKIVEKRAKNKVFLYSQAKKNEEKEQKTLEKSPEMKWEKSLKKKRV